MLMGKRYVDPFYIKEEFAPSDRDAIVKRQQATQNLIAPHFRLIQFLCSHFNATRLCSPHIERTYYRLIHATLGSIHCIMGSPLVRENYFYIILLGLQMLRYGTNSSVALRWRLKDRILSSGLAWFSLPQRYPYPLFACRSKLTLVDGPLEVINFRSRQRSAFSPTSRML